MKLKNLTKYIIAAMLIIGIAYIIYNNATGAEKCVKTSFALNTYTTVTTYGSNGKMAVRSAEDAINAVEKNFSAYIDSSEVSALNSVQKKDVPIHVSDELFNIIKTACRYSAITEGRFDITIKPVSDLWSISENPHVPSQSKITEALAHVGYENILLNEADKTVTFLKDGMQLDLGGIAKGYAADRTLTAIKSAGCTKALVDLGGNICVLGENVSTFDSLANKYFGQHINKPWRIGIQAPFATSGTYCAIVSLAPASNTYTSIVTSGAYERNFTQDGVLYHHILDPHTGYPYNGDIDSITIIGASSMDADALSTSAYMMDIDDAMSLADGCGYDIIVVDKNKKIHTTLDKSSVEITDNTYSFAN